jgi:two-component system chemotaxis response regulator CheY
MFPSEAKILMVDDSGFSRSVLKSALRELNFANLVEAKDVASAQRALVDAIQSQSPVHLIICDNYMPEVNGIDFLKWLREHDPFKAMPVIMLTTSQEKSVIVEAGKIGVSHYMLKPFDIPTLKDRLTAVWEKCGQKFFEENKPN